MSENIRVESPVEIKDKSIERVAYDLMKHIAYHDDRAENEQNDRKYWFTLYRQCWKAAYGSQLEYILKEE